MAATIHGTHTTARPADPGLSERLLSGKVMCKRDLRG
jgi:hypothetical protein